MNRPRMTPEERLALTNDLAALSGGTSGAFFQAHDLGAAYARPGRYSSKRDRIVSALTAAERQGGLDAVLEAARTFVEGEQRPAANAQEGAGLKNVPRAVEAGSGRVSLMSAVQRFIFISHAYADRAVAHLLSESLNLAGVPDSEIFFSSSRATGVPAGVDVLKDLQAALSQAQLVVELVSEAFLSRPMCMMEFGAAWAMEKKTFPIVLGPLERSKATAEVGNVFMHHLASDDAVDEMLNDLHEAVVGAIGRVITAASWAKSTKHFKAGLPSVLLPPTPAAPPKSAGTPKKKASSSPRKTAVVFGRAGKPATSLPTSSAAPGKAPVRASGATATTAAGSVAPSAVATPRTTTGPSQATDELRAALSQLHRASRWVVLHHTLWREGYVGRDDAEREGLSIAEGDREIEFSENYDGWTPRDGHRKVGAAIQATKAWRTAVEESDPDEAEQFLDDYDLNELDAKSHDNWRKLDLV